MEQLPKIVTQRLQATAKAGPHLDPNLLTALAEQSLTERERVQVLEHMAHCADCREIVALSLPEFEMAHAAAAAPAKAGWLSWPVLRWGAAVACVLVVGAAVTLRHQRRANPSPMIAPTQSAAPATEDQLSASAATKSSLEVQSPSPAKPDAAVAPALSKQLGRSEFAKSRSAAAASASGRADTRPQSAPSSQVAVAATPLREKAPELEAKEERPNEPVGVFAAKSSEQLADKAAPALEVAEAMPGKAKDAAPKVPASGAGMVGGAVVANRKAARLAPVENEVKSSYAANTVLPRWTLSSDGALQRSLDAGKTWQIIPVPGNATFRALAAVGAEIWVGGASGALYHSSDAGEHWVQVKPVADGKALTAGIISVEFSDARHGKLATTGDETWTTTDGGQSWQSK
jgi:hypothetical protein